MYFLYTIIYTIVIIFLFPFEYFKRPKELRKRWIREKFGLSGSSFSLNNPPAPPLTKGAPPLHPLLSKGGTRGGIWVHAVSVGEVIAAVPILKKLKTKYPSRDIILSTITDTGQKVARERSPEGTKVIYLPFDIPAVLNKVLKQARPELLIVIETELWPNMFRIFKGKGIPVILLNGRISEKSFSGYKKVAFFMRKVLSNVDFFGMQDEQYAGRVVSLGADSRRVQNLGNLKFDANPPSQVPPWASKIRGPVITAGSTHEGEEELITSMYIELKKDFPELNLIIAPRHPERFKSVEDMLKVRNMPFLKRSAILPNHKAGTISGAVILLDSVGELSAVYGTSDIVIVGKSFRGYGGQNPLEPAFWGKPVICGPHMENFPVIRDFYDAGAAVEVSEERLYHKLRELLLSPEKAKVAGMKAQELYRKNAGAVERAMEVVARFVAEQEN